MAKPKKSGRSPKARAKEKPLAGGKPEWVKPAEKAVARKRARWPVILGGAAVLGAGSYLALRHDESRTLPDRPPVYQFYKAPDSHDTVTNYVLKTQGFPGDKEFADSVRFETRGLSHEIHWNEKLLPPGIEAFLALGNHDLTNNIVVRPNPSDAPIVHKHTTSPVYAVLHNRARSPEGPHVTVFTKIARPFGGTVMAARRMPDGEYALFPIKKLVFQPDVVAGRSKVFPEFRLLLDVRLGANKTDYSPRLKGLLDELELLREPMGSGFPAEVHITVPTESYGFTSESGLFAHSKRGAHAIMFEIPPQEPVGEIGMGFHEGSHGVFSAKAGTPEHDAFLRYVTVGLNRHFDSLAVGEHERVKAELVKLMDESEFFKGSDPSIGHPEENPDETFASVSNVSHRFGPEVLSRLKAIEKDEAVHKPAITIFNLVHRVMGAHAKKVYDARLLDYVRTWSEKYK